MKPTSFRIGQIEYQIHYRDDIEEFGRFTEHEKIEINIKHSDIIQRISTLHEIIHALERYAGMDMQEKEIRVLTHILFDFVSENKHIARHIFKL